MLTWIRNKSTGLFMTIVMILLIAAFALWGVGDYFTQSGNDTVATVNGETISYTEYSNSFTSYRNNMISQFGEGFDPSYFDSPVLKRNYLDSMINSELVRQVAKENGFTVTAEEIRETIEEFPNFKDENGQFDKNRYAAFLSQTNQSANMLQMKIADEQAGQALNGMFDQTSFVTPQEAKIMAQLNNQTRSIEYITVSPSKFLETTAVSDDEINAYYNENSNQFMTDEMVSVNYIEVSAEDVADGIDVSEVAALEYYETNKASYNVPEQRMASHILINAGDEASQTIEEIQAKLAAGEDFAELAKTYSDDPGSATSGGDLGWVSPGDMVEEFNDALFDMELNTVSAAVETQFGTHIIQLNDIKEENTPVYEAVKDEIIQALKAFDSESLFLEKASELAEAVLDAQSGLEEASEQTGYEIKTSDLFARSGGADLAANPAFIQAAFSPAVKDELSNSDVVNISDTHVVFMHLNEVKEAQIKPLDDVKESIISTLKSQHANEAAKALADTIVSEANTTEQSLADLATTNDLELITDSEVARTGSTLPFNLVNELFNLARPSEDTPVTAMVLSGNGSDSVVVKLLAVNEVDIDSIEDMTVESAQLGRNIKNNEQQLMIQALREAASVTINQDLLNQVNNL